MVKSIIFGVCILIFLGLLSHVYMASSVSLEPPREFDEFGGSSYENEPARIEGASNGINRAWRSATYRGLEVGKSNRQDMLRVLGKPRFSAIPQARITTNPNTIVAYHYQGPERYDGNIELVVGVEKATGIIAWISSRPESLSRDHIIRQFGADYIHQFYEPDECFVDGQMKERLYEVSEGPINSIYEQMEYRRLGMAIQFRTEQEVYQIVYISDKWAYGATSSLCSQPQKGLAYIACGCGCCGDEFISKKCLFRSKGDDLEAIVQSDKEAQKDPNCATMGCSLGIKYVYCD